VNGLEPPPFFEQLKSLASQFVGRVIVIDGFLKTLAQIQEAVCWSVWPSFYEPCGGASEPLSMGTPAIARRTGGLPTQLIYSETGETAGILYRELAPLDVNDQTAWREIEEAPTPEARMDSKLYVSMVDALVRAIEEAVEIRQNQPERYSRMLALTTEQVSAPVFSAERFGSNYWRLYKRAIS
jgi:glycosyltransferase involved in cell wall biosynthesis